MMSCLFHRCSLMIKSTNKFLGHIPNLINLFSSTNVSDHIVHSDFCLYSYLDQFSVSLVATYDHTNQFVFLTDIHLDQSFASSRIIRDEVVLLILLIYFYHDLSINSWIVNQEHFKTWSVWVEVNGFVDIHPRALFYFFVYSSMKIFP